MIPSTSLGLAWVGVAAVALPGDAVRPDPFAWLHALEWPWIRAVQSVDGLGRVMGWISDLGPGRPMLVVIALAFFLVNSRFAARLAVLTFLALGLRELLAMVLQSPRPYWFGDGIRTFASPPLSSPTFGLPSGHATGAAAFWFFLAAESGRRWAWSVAAVIVAGVGISRVYLGVHFPSDVVLGIVLGTTGMVAFRKAEVPFTAAWAAGRPFSRAAVAIGIGLGLVLLSYGVRAWVDATVPENVWMPFGATARNSTGFGWSAGALTGLALAYVRPLGWTGEGDPWRLKLERLAWAAAPAAFYFFRPRNLRLSHYLPDTLSAAAHSGIRFVAGVGLGWAAFYLLPRGLAWLGRAGSTRSQSSEKIG